MKKLSPSLRIYAGLIIFLAILGATGVYFQAQELLPGRELPLSKPLFALVNAGIMLVLYGGLGYIGLRLSAKLGFSPVWDKKIPARQRLLIPALAGAVIGVFFIVADHFFSKINGLGPFPHPSFPLSLIASVTAGIGEEVIFRLFFISFWVWLISYVILKNRYQDVVFWIFVVFSSLAFAMGHLPSVMYLFGFTVIRDMPPALLVELILLNGVLSVFTAYYFRKYGFLAPVILHFCTDLVWHVLWGVVS